MKKWDIELLILSCFCFMLCLTDMTFADAEHIFGALISFGLGATCIYCAKPKKPVIDPGEGYYLIDTEKDRPSWNDEFWSDGVWLRREAGTACFTKGLVYRRMKNENVVWNEEARTACFNHQMNLK
jgi:hypothetical protein